MREFCKFNDIYERINVLEESVSKNFPGLKPSWSKAAGEARKVGAGAPTREAKSIILNIVVGLMSKRIGRELTTQEERDLLRFRNIPSQKPLVKFLKTQEIDGKTYASVINDASPADIEEAASGTGIADPVEFQLGQRSEQRKEVYKRRAEDRAEAKAEAEAMADAAEEGGDEELANSLDEVGDYIVKFAKGITEVGGSSLDFDDLDVDLSLAPGKDEIAERLKGIMADAGYTVEITPAGINAEAPVGTFGDQDKAEDLVKGLVMKLYPDVREDQVAVFLNTDTAVEDGETYQSPYTAYDGPISQCCGGEPIGGALDGNLGACSECNKGSTFIDIGPGTPVGIGDNNDYYIVVSVDGNEVTVKDHNEEQRIFYIDEINDVYEQAEETVTESYTSQYVVGLPQKSEDKVEPIVESISFRERYKPKTSQQLEELRRYGL
jgi:hypothetical protein